MPTISLFLSSFLVFSLWNIVHFHFLSSARTLECCSSNSEIPWASSVALFNGWSPKNTWKASRFSCNIFLIYARCNFSLRFREALFCTILSVNANGTNEHSFYLPPWQQLYLEGTFKSKFGNLKWHFFFSFLTKLHQWKWGITLAWLCTTLSPQPVGYQNAVDLSIGGQGCKGKQEHSRISRMGLATRRKHPPLLPIPLPLASTRCQRIMDEQLGKSD